MTVETKSNYLVAIFLMIKRSASFPYISTKKNLTNLRTKFLYMNFKFTLTLHVFMLLVLYYWIQLPLALDNLNFFFGEASWIIKCQKAEARIKSFQKRHSGLKATLLIPFCPSFSSVFFNLIFYEMFYSSVLNIHISSFFVKNKISNCFASHSF